MSPFPQMICMCGCGETHTYYKEYETFGVLIFLPGIFIILKDHNMEGTVIKETEHLKAVASPDVEIEIVEVFQTSNDWRNS